MPSHPEQIQSYNRGQNYLWALSKLSAEPRFLLPFLPEMRLIDLYRHTLTHLIWDLVSKLSISVSKTEISDNPSKAMLHRQTFIREVYQLRPRPFHANLPIKV
jgi:hypothetical protein